MDRPDDTSDAHLGRNQNAANLEVSTETSPRTQLQQRIEASRAHLLQACGVLKCLYEVLLHAEGEDAVLYAQAAQVAANLINNTAEELDSVNFR